MSSVWLSPRRKGRWLVCWRDNSGKRGSAICPNKLLAIEYRQKKQEDLARERLGLPRSATSIPFDDFSKKYLTHRKAHREGSTCEIDKRALESYSKYAPGVMLNSIQRVNIEEWKMEALKSLNPHTVRMYFRSLRAAFNHALQNSYIDCNPCAGVEAPKCGEVGRVLTAGEIQAIGKALPDLVSRAFVFNLQTGLRLSELIGLSWDQVRDGEIVIGSIGRKTKTKTVRRIPLSKEAIRAMGKRGEGQVFAGLNISLVEGALRRARMRLGLGRVRWHDLRHTWACARASGVNGVDLETLRQEGGWRSLTSVMCYQHYTKARHIPMVLDFGSGKLPTRSQLNGRGDNRNH